ncbi:hypothetical protein IKF20_02765 [Candidatus Saccharibacteria bacterium]|nr:hypothetical protein [Candidatus Saccharibacteria bacterium]
MRKEYEEILQHSHYEPKHHPRMSREMRAAQFAPYAALAGYDQAVKRTAQCNELRSRRVIISDIENEGTDYLTND